MPWYKKYVSGKVSGTSLVQIHTFCKLVGTIHKEWPKQIKCDKLIPRSRLKLAFDMSGQKRPLLQDDVRLTKQSKIKLTMGCKLQSLAAPAGNSYMQIHRKRFSAQDGLLCLLREVLPFSQPKPFCGNEVRRRTAFLHMPHTTPVRYRFGGETWESRDIPPEALEAVVDMRTISESVSGSTPNVVLVQLYDTDGAISWHADDEKLVMSRSDDGEVLPIVSFSLGADAEFCIRPKEGKPRKTTKMWLQHGDVLVMMQGAQERYEHCIFKGGITGERMSFTFRTQQCRGH